MKPTKSRTVKPVLFALSLLLLAAGVASAASFPLLGSWDWGFNWNTLFISLGLLALIASFPAGKVVVRNFPIGGRFIAGAPVVLAVVFLALAAWMNPGSILNTASAADFSGTDPGAGAVLSSTWDPNLHEPTSAVTFTMHDAYTFGTAIAPVVKVYKAGVSETDAALGTASPLYTKTASSGSAEFTAIQTQTIGCLVDVLLDLDNYYLAFHEDINVCKAKNVLGNDDVSPPTLDITKYGTLSLAKTDTTLTCSAGSQCSYSLILRNTAANTAVLSPAVLFTNVANATLDAVDAGGACTIVTVSGSQYVQFTGEQAKIGPLGTVTCPLKISRTAGSDDGSYKWTADDLLFRYGATAHATNGNINHAAATSAVTVTFA